MKNKGFTLAELLGVIIIIALLSLITVPTVSNSLQKYKSRICETQLDQIIAAAKNWGQDNLSLLPSEACNGSNENKCKKFVTLRDLIKMNYLDSDIKNPLNKEKYNLDNTKIYVSKRGKKFYYELDETTKKSCIEKK